MDEKGRTDISKFLSYVLRHKPEAVGISLTTDGWVDVDMLLSACAKKGRPLSRAELDEVVATNPKKRFALSKDNERIRANQGHSISIDLGYDPAEPPDILFHGAVARHLPAIRAEGLRRMKRHHVHLSPDTKTAQVVGRRRGQPVVLQIDAKGMYSAGHVFFVTPNDVWLTDEVPSSFISVWRDEDA